MQNTKKSLINLIFICTISLTLFSCREIDKEGPKDEHVDAPTEIVTVADASKLYNTYEKRRVELIQKYEDSIDGYSNDGKTRQEQNALDTEQDPNDPNGERFDVARYVYWDYETIKNYLKYVEQEAKAADIEISTLRFYFSNNPENDNSAVHPRQNSIMITPTLHRNDREYIFSIDEEGASPRPILLSDSFGQLKDDEKGMGTIDDNNDQTYASFIPFSSLGVAAPTYQGGKSVTMNKGNSAPPPHH
jgi:hypothetical protein